MVARTVVVAVGLAPALVMARYGQPPCGPDEVQGEVQGASGNICSPRCDVNSYNCPMDMPYGSTAQPQCMLKDVDQAAFCALLCQVDSQCPSGARCRQLKQVEVGTCLYPVSFTDWARSSVTRKFAVGWPKQSGGSPANFQIARTYSSLQNLKSKYSIDDGDADMVTLKEFLSSLSPTAAAAAAAATAGTVGGSPVGTAPATSSSGGDFSPKKWLKDAAYFEENVLLGGVPGIQKEIHDTVWNLEHLERRGVATELFRSIVMLGCVYVALGCLIKSQMHGARGMEMIPHIGFWMEYPKLCADGVTYARILAGGYLGAPKAGGGSHDDLSGGLGRSSRGGVGSFDAL